MATQNPKDRPPTTDQILDLLLDALIERQKARRMQSLPAIAARPEPARVDQGQPVAQPAKPEKTAAPSIPPARPEPPPAEQRRPAAVRPGPASPPWHKPQPGEEGWEPTPKLPSIHTGRMLVRLAILIGVLIILVNIPVNRYGVSLARILPETSSLIIRDGLVLKGSGPEIYVLEEEKLRWISSLDAFEHLGLTWEDVHVVEDTFLDKYEKGRPIHVLLKCDGSPHIYRLENQEKRWIKDIDTFLDEGHVWEDVRFVSCQYLRGLPSGLPIPEDAGPPPEP